MSALTRNGTRAALVAVAGILAVGASRVSSPAAAPEHRGIWVTRFEWPRTDPAACRAFIDQVMADLASHNFNAVLFQIRGQGDVLYPSPYEPWSELTAPTGADPGWDPLAYAIDAAHANGLEFEAYINTHVAWQAPPGAGNRPPLDPTHLYFQHCNAADPAHRDWLIHDANGVPVQYDESNYVWMAPGVPDMQAYVRKQVMYVVNHYDIDGFTSTASARRRTIRRRAAGRTIRSHRRGRRSEAKATRTTWRFRTGRATRSRGSTGTSTRRSTRSSRMCVWAAHRWASTAGSGTRTPAIRRQTAASSTAICAHTRTRRRGWRPVPWTASCR